MFIIYFTANFSRNKDYCLCNTCLYILFSLSLNPEALANICPTNFIRSKGVNLTMLITDHKLSNQMKITIEGISNHRSVK